MSAAQRPEPNILSVGEGEQATLVASQQMAQRRAASMAAVIVRRNRPRGLVYIAGAMCLAAAVFTIVSWVGVRQARASRNAAASEQAKIEALFEEAGRIRGDLQRAAFQKRFEEEPLLGKLSESLRDHGFESAAYTIKAEERRRSFGSDTDWPLVLWTVDIDLKDVHNPEPVLRWLTNVSESVDGLHVREMSMVPLPYGWKITIGLGRWQWSATR